MTDSIKGKHSFYIKSQDKGNGYEREKERERERGREKNGLNTVI